MTGVGAACSAASAATSPAASASEMCSTTGACATSMDFFFFLDMFNDTNQCLLYHVWDSVSTEIGSCEVIAVAL